MIEPKPLTVHALDELARLHEESKSKSSGSWTCGKTRDDGTAQVYSPSLGPLRKIVPIAETLPEFGNLIATSYGALPRLIAMARLSLTLAKRAEEAEAQVEALKGRLSMTLELLKDAREPHGLVNYGLDPDE